MVCCIDKLPPRSTALPPLTIIRGTNHTTPSHAPLYLWTWAWWYSTKGTSLANRPSHQRAEGCGKGARGGVTSNLHHNTRARLHESSLSPAGLPKYDLFSPRSRQKPLAHEIGAQTQPLWPLTRRARLTHYASKTRQGRLHAARKRDGNSHPRRHTPAFC